MLKFSIRESGEPAVVSPIGRAAIAAEARREFACRRARKFLREYSAVVQPGLKVTRRCFDNQRRHEAGIFHPLKSIDFQIIDKSQGVKDTGFTPALIIETSALA